MYCKNCGKQIEDGKDLCDACAEAERNTTTVESEIPEQVYSSNEGPIKTNNTSSSSNSSTVNSNSTTNPELKSKMAAGLFGIFLGSFGVHNFYLGYTGKAVAQLLISLLTCGAGAAISGIWGLIEGILILTGSINKDAQGNPLRD